MSDPPSTLSSLKRANRDLSLLEYKTGKVELRSLPRALFVELTQGCNLRCPMCRGEVIAPTSRAMTPRLFDRIAQELFPTAELVDLRGWGESLVLKEALERINTTRRFGVRIRIVTNLSFRRDAVLEALVAAEAMIDVSLDTSDAELLRRVRGGARLELIVRNIRYLVDRFGHARNLALLVTVQRETLATLPSLLELSADLGIPEVRLFSVTAEKDSACSIEELPTVVDDALHRAREVARDRGVTVILGTRMGSLPVNSADMDSCLHPWAYCYINFEGSVGFCDHLIGPGNAQYLVGDLRKSPFRSIWNGEAMQTLRLEHLRQRREGASRFAHCSWCYKNKYVDFEHLFLNSAREERVRL